MIGLGLLRRAALAGALAGVLSSTGGLLDGPAMRGWSLASPAAAATIVIQRTTIYVSTLPSGCVKMKFGSYVVWKCGTTYYQAYKGRYVVVYIKNG